MIKENTTWMGNGQDEFLVLHTVEIDGHRWVHYRDQKGREYSCYEDAFLLRFRPYINKRYDSIQNLAR